MHLYSEVLSKNCKQCEQWKYGKDTVEYSNWKENYICAINHTGSAGAMEVVGLIRIFHRSERLHNLRYTFIPGYENFFILRLISSHTRV